MTSMMSFLGRKRTSYFASFFDGAGASARAKGEKTATAIRLTIAINNLRVFEFIRTFTFINLLRVNSRHLFALLFASLTRVSTILAVAGLVFPTFLSAPPADFRTKSADAFRLL